MGTPRLTRVDEIYNTLLDLYREQPEIDGRFVIDGGASTNDFNNDYVFFGFRPGAEEWITIDRQATAGMAANDIETVIIPVLISAVDPQDNMRTARANATTKLSVLERIVTKDPKLGLGGVKAVVDSHAWRPVHTTNGAECNIFVDIKVEVTL